MSPRSNDAVVGIAAMLVAGCGGGGSPAGATAGAVNVLPLSVDGSLCGANASYLNEPCVQVKVCEPGTGTCLTVDDVLLDTGSFGLRLFRQALGSLSLRQVSVAGIPVATCAQFADQTSDWGPIQLADVVLGNEPPVEVPIQVIDATFASPPASCPQPEASPSVAQFNGILGVGVFQQDCGPGCEQTSSNGIYFSCGASGCAGTTMALDLQIQNPVALLPLDNNGVIVELPEVGPSGTRSVEGSLVLGIGTRANNALTGAITYPVDPSDGTFTTTLEGSALSRSFLDTGSNGLFFSPPSGSALPDCTGSDAAWYCPSSPVSLTATNAGRGGTPSGDVPFQVADFDALVATPNQVFADVGGEGVAGAGFDWGLPFYLGRRVAIGIEGRTSQLGPGPYVAF